jgi:hypothetical protein
MFIRRWLYAGGGMGLMALALGLARPAAAQYVAVDLGPRIPSLHENFGTAQGTSGGQQVGYTGAEEPRALLWTGAPSPIVVLHPGGFNNSKAFAVSGGQQVGEGMIVDANGINSHALLWTGTAGSVMDLHPSGYVSSSAVGVYGDKQVGSGYTLARPPIMHALVWSGTPDSVVALPPPIGFTNTSAAGIYGDTVIGTATASSGVSVAVLWPADGGSPSVLPGPVGTSPLLSTYGAGIWADQQVGHALIPDPPPATTGHNHAVLWMSGFLIDLHPTGYEDSQALGVAAGTQVGYGQMGGHFHALAWSGNIASVVDLNRFLPGSVTAAFAFGVDEDGNIVGAAQSSSFIGTHAFLWKLVAVDVSNQVSIAPGGFRLNRTTGRYVQQVLLTNTGLGSISGPVSLVLDHLSSNATFFNRTGITSSVPPTGSPYLNMATGGLAAGDSVTATLEFTNPTNQAITYDTRVLAGRGSR